MSLQAIILAGGKGTRLATRLNGRPKPLVDVAGTPLLKRQIDALRGAGVDDVVILVNHAADQIHLYCASEGNFGLRNLQLIDDGEPRGTAGAVLGCLDKLASRFLVVYGDTLFNIDFSRFLAEHERYAPDATLFLHPNDHPADSDLVSLDDGGMISGFHPKPRPSDALFQNLVNAALYIVERDALLDWREMPLPCDFGANLFPAMLAAGSRLKAYSSFEYIKDIGTPARLEKAEQDLARGVLDRANLARPQPCIFLDRDGTVNELNGYVREPDEFRLLRGAANAVRRFNLAEHRVAIVTNQPVIARGDCSFEQLQLIHAKMDMLLAESGAYLDRLYFCPHHPDSGFVGEVPDLKIRCRCRKPETGLLLEGARDLHADLARSWMIGDSTSDILAASEFGVRSVLVRTGEGGKDGKYPIAPDFVVDDLSEAAEFILNIYPRVEALAEKLIADINAGSLILIGGAARTGKSTVARALFERLRTRGIRAAIVRLDNWMRSTNEGEESLRGRFDLEGFCYDLRPWLERHSARVAAPCYDGFKKRLRDAVEPGICPDDVVIVEGVPALILPISTERRVLRIHLRSNEQERRDRVIKEILYRGSGSYAESVARYESRLQDELQIIEPAGYTACRSETLDEFYKDWSHA